MNINFKIQDFKHEEHTLEIILDDAKFNYNCYAEDRAVLTLKFGDQTSTQDFSEISEAIKSFNHNDISCVFMSGNDILLSFKLNDVAIGDRNDHFYLEDKEIEVFGLINKN